MDSFFIQDLSASSREEFYRDLEGPLAEIDGIYRRNESARKIGVYDADLISRLPSSVKWIAHNGAGYDQIDIAACKARGAQRTVRYFLITPLNLIADILVTHTPGAVNEATATTALYLIIATCRQFTRGERNILDGQWKKDFTAAHDPSSKTLGILGFGGIGLHTAELAQVFPMRVVYHSRKRAQNAPEWAEYCPTMAEFLEKTDVLSIHVPLNEETTGLVGEKEIRALRKGSIIVNTARGKILDEDALIRALQDGHVSELSLDPVEF